jgi:hypothetical protein
MYINNLSPQGKSTLLRHISQRHLPIPEHIQILHVEQEVEGSDTPAIKAVLEAVLFLKISFLHIS